MALLTNLQNMMTNQSQAMPTTPNPTNDKLGNDLTGMSNAIQNFVEAKKGASNMVDKKKHGIIKKAIKNSKK